MIIKIFIFLEIGIKIREYGQTVVQLLNALQDENISSEDVNKNIQDVKNCLNEITSQIGIATSNIDGNMKLEDLVDDEMKKMDAAIEEAAGKFIELLAQSRASNSGLQLEVNEKILDSCTNLMECIKQLIKNSRKVQEEIIASGKGTATEKEFYKRNHQWTEGLISAAGAVARGAKYLV
jgi:huntingtin interacting protein 1